MDNSILNSLQLYKGKRFSDLIDTNKISSVSKQSPYQVATVLSWVFGTKDGGYSTSLDMITGGLGNTLTIDRPSFEWEVWLEGDKAVTIRDAQWNGASVTETSTAGLGNTPIKVWVEDNIFGPGAIVEFDDRNFQARIEGTPYQDGGLWVYTMYLSNGDPSAYIPSYLLESGARLSRLASAYEEGSEEGDILSYSTPVKLRNYLTTIRINHDITGSAYSTVMAIELKDPRSGKSSYLWSTYQEWVALRAWFKRCERMLIYMQSNVNKDGSCSLKGTNGRPVFIGAGLHQQISPSNKRYYTQLTAELIEDFLTDLSYNIVGTNERKFVGLSGEMGLREFDNAMKQKMGGMNLVDTVFVSGSGENLKLGGQFKTYSMANGIELTMKHLPIYDDTEVNRQLHPITLKPLESYRITILDLGRRDGEANIVKVVRKDREFVTWYSGGSVGPDGYKSSVNSLSSNGKDGYTVYYLGEMGIMVRDPRACGELIMDASLAA